MVCVPSSVLLLAWRHTRAELRNLMCRALGEADSFFAARYAVCAGITPVHKYALIQCNVCALKTLFSQDEFLSHTIVHRRHVVHFHCLKLGAVPGMS